MHSADHALVARDPALTGLPVLLDDGQLTGWLARYAPGCTLLGRTYLRYKPGTSGVLGLELDGPAGPRPAALLVVSADAAVKLDKARDRAPAGSVLAWDPDARLLLLDPRADRDLPALARLGDPDDRGPWLAGLLPGTDVRGAALATLSHKPQRRWVGLLTPVGGPPLLLRAHRPETARATAAALAALTDGPPALPRLLTHDDACGLVVVDHVAGQPLDRLPDAPGPARAVLEQTGAALAALHGRTAPDLRRRRPERAGEAVTRAASGIGDLLPMLAERARAVAAAIAAEVGAQEPVTAVPCHGDFSLDQAVRTPDGAIALIDLDEAGLDDPAADLVGPLAAALVHRPAQAAAVHDALLTGYAGHRELPGPRVLATQTAAALLRRAVEPFRSARPDWPDQASRVLDAAEEALP